MLQLSQQFSTTRQITWPFQEGKKNLVNIYVRVYILRETDGSPIKHLSSATFL